MVFISAQGVYYIIGKGNLEDMTYACEFSDQNNDKFFLWELEIKVLTQIDPVE